MNKGMTLKFKYYTESGIVSKSAITALKKEIMNEKLIVCKGARLTKCSRDCPPHKKKYVRSCGGICRIYKKAFCIPVQEAANGNE